MTESLDQGQQQFQLDEARRFLELLGKDPAKTWLRCIKPGRNGAREHKGLDSRWITRKSDEGFNLYAVIGNATAATSNRGCVQDTDITNVPALFVEWDDKPMEWQLTAWQTLNLPEPTVIVATGGPSLHCYWVLTEPLEPLEWRRIAAQLIAHCDSDKACCNPSRLMRLPGSIYYDKKTGEPTGKCRILSDNSTRYSAAEIVDCLPAPATALVRPVAVEPNRRWAPRSIEEINAAAEFIPERVVGGGTYPESRNALCGCSAALEEAGAEDPDGMALALLGHLWPDERTVRQVLESTTTREAKSFWAIAKEGGYQLKPSAEAASNAKKGAPMSYTKLIKAALAATIDGKDDEAMTLRAEAMLHFRRKDSQIESALFKLHTKNETQGKQIKPPDSLDLSNISGMDWLIEGFFPDKDISLVWGPAGSGKTTAALAASRAVLLGTGFLDHQKQTEKGAVLFIASDSGASPLVAAMQEMAMIDLVEVKEGPGKRFHVWASDPDQGMQSWAANLRGCVRLLNFIKEKEIKLVFIDSCKKVCSSGDIDYTDNALVTSLLTYFKEVICQHAAVVFINHDGTAKGATAGAKAWKEIPSAVHHLNQEEKADGTTQTTRRLWKMTKSRMGPERSFYYQFQNGRLELSPQQESVGNCHRQVVQVLADAIKQDGVKSLKKEEIRRRVCKPGGPTLKTLDNTLTSATLAKNPEICREGYGRYKLAPRVLALYRSIEDREETAEKQVIPIDLPPSRYLPDGKVSQLPGTSEECTRATGQKLPAFPETSQREVNGNMLDPSEGERSKHILPEQVLTTGDSHGKRTPEGIEQSIKDAEDFCGVEPSMIRSGAGKRKDWSGTAERMRALRNQAVSKSCST
jgi:hypothetical protein